MTVSEATVERAWRIANGSLEAKDAATAARKAGRYNVQPIWELTATPVQKNWLAKGIIARGETSAWIAPPGGMKSALMAELAFCLANSEPDWHGHKIVPSMHCVVYFALERADLVKRRLLAHVARAGLDAETVSDLPIFVIGETVDLATAAAVEKVMRTLRHIYEEFYAVPPGLLIFDTFAKLIAAGDGDEDKARDQGKIFANIQRIKDLMGNGGPHVALVGHTGKDESRGSRGSNAFLGDADVMVTIAGGEIKTATVAKANDLPTGPLFSFKSEIHQFGTDEDGEPITVNIVSPEEVSAAPPPDRGPKLTANQKTMLAILADAGAAGLFTRDWDAKGRDAGIGVRRRADLTDARTGLKAKSLVREYMDVWHINR